MAQDGQDSRDKPEIDRKPGDGSAATAGPGQAAAGARPRSSAAACALVWAAP